MPSGLGWGMRPLVRIAVATGSRRSRRRAVGRRLRTARVVLNISQQDVADAAGCSRNFVSGIERGAQGVDAYRLSLVALALRMRPRTLMEGDGWDSWMNGMNLGIDE